MNKDKVQPGPTPEMRRPKPGPDALAAALESAQRLAAELDAEQGAEDSAHALASAGGRACSVCGHRIRSGSKFCGMCGASANDPAESEFQRPAPLPPNPFLDPPSNPMMSNQRPGETHHYHHHYHHHYFNGAGEGMPRGDSGRAELGRDSTRDLAREDRLRPSAAQRGDMSRAEAAVRRVSQEWVLACNTKHLDDLLELYVPDALVIRSNYSPLRGAAAVREFFFGALDAGLGEVELDPLRMEVVGEMAYEAGRCKALVPGATGKRREERGKYVWVCARQSDGSWKLAVDCWSSDLSLTTLESDAPPSGGVRTSQPRKNS